MSGILGDRRGSQGCATARRYGPVLEEMYTQMEQRQRERQSAMRDAAAQGTVLDKVKQVTARGSFSKIWSPVRHGPDACCAS